MEALKGESEFPVINNDYIGNVEEMKSKDRSDFDAGIQGKFVYMTQWMQNINFLAGNQWMRFNPNSKLFELDANLGEEERITINKVLPAYRMAVGSLLRDRQTPKVLQENTDEQSIDSAKVKTRLLEHVRRTGKWLGTQKEALQWSAICGKGINKKFWDPEQEAIVDEVFPAFEFVVPSNVRKLKKMPWVCHARFETTEWVYENYGVDISEGNNKKSKSKMKTTGTSDLGMYGSFLAAVKHIMQDGFFSGTGNTLNWNNVLIKEFWRWPCKKYPDGLLTIYANDELLYADRNPISGKISELVKGKVKIGQRDKFYSPFNELDFFDLPFRYWPMGLIEPIVGIQMYYNKFFSNTLENFKYGGMPLIWAQEGSVDQDSINRDAGSVNEYAAGSPKPEEVVPQAVNPAMFQVMNDLAGAVGEIVGIHQLGRGGSLPPGVHAAAALAIINEQDQISKMGITVNLEDFIANDAQQTLYLIDKYWPEKTKIRYMGDENRWEVIEFEKEKYAIGDEEIVIESKQELATDKMTRFDQVMKMMSTPRIDEPTKSLMDVNDGMRLLDLQNDMGYVNIVSLNWNMAKNENMKLAKGDQVQVLQYEDHKQHIQAHMEDMLRVDFKDKPQEIQNTYLTHWQQHVQLMNGAQESVGASATQGDQQQQMMLPQGQMPMQPMPQMGQPQMMQGMPMQGQPMQQPPMQPQQATGLAGGIQGGMSNVMQIAAGAQR